MYIHKIADVGERKRRYIYMCPVYKHFVVYLPLSKVQAYKNAPIKVKKN